MKLEVGMYVRTNLGQIGKLKEINPYYLKIEIKKSLFYTFEVEDAVKASYNITDILEVGDYVNGDNVIKIFNPMFLSIGELPYIITINGKYEEQEIETIVTKEQMEQIAYKVGE